MTNEHCLRWAISKHLRDRGSRLDMKGVKLGNAVIDGEVIYLAVKIVGTG
jgi:hypothetical protein